MDTGEYLPVVASLPEGITASPSASAFCIAEAAFLACALLRGCGGFAAGSCPGVLLPVAGVLAACFAF